MLEQGDDQTVKIPGQWGSPNLTATKSQPSDPVIPGLVDPESTSLKHKICSRAFTIITWNTFRVEFNDTTPPVGNPQHPIS